MTSKPEAPLDERAKFEAWARDAFVCSEHSFAQAHPYGYFNSVSSQTFGGRVQPRYAEVQMLWDTWRGARETALASPSLPLPSDLSDPQAWAWEQVRQQVGTKGWTVGESATYYGFFSWGWHYRTQLISRAGQQEQAVLSDLSDEQIFATAKQHLGERGHDLIWESDPQYASACDMPKDSRWSLSSVRAESTIAFARAILAASRLPSGEKS